MRTSVAPRILLLAVFACCAQAWAQRASTSSAAQTQYHGAVFGHVYCADTDAPARFAQVILRRASNSDDDSRGGSLQTIGATGLDGSFRIENVPPGTYYVVAATPGYVNPLSAVSSEDLSSQDPDTVARIAELLTPVTVNTEPVKAEIRLERGASISGTVYYDDGSPAVNVQINVQHAGASSGMHYGVMRNLLPGQEPRTDDYGRYRVNSLPTGDYVVQASIAAQDAGPFGGPAMRQSSSLFIYAPKNFTAVDAKVYSLKTGTDMTGVDIQIPLAGFHTVSGVFASSDGSPAGREMLTLTDTKDKTHSFRSILQGDGQFSFLFVPEGSYTLTATGGVAQNVLVENGDITNLVVQPVGQTPTASNP